MRTYERNGVHVDQCSECRGIFLDRGELDRLIDAENAWHGDERSETPRPDDQGRKDEEYRREHERQSYASGHSSASSSAGLGAVVGEVLRQVQGSKSHSSHSSDYYSKKRKKESFLGDLFG
jgi:uncharacterized protein